MKTYNFLGLSLMIVLFACSCKKKITINSPAYPARGVYFQVTQEKEILISNKSLTLKKLDATGTVLETRPLIELINIGGKRNIFRLTDSWTITQKFFSNGENTFLLDYGDIITDTIKIKAILDTSNNTTIFQEVLFNNKIIIPEILNKPAENSSIYNLQ